jgi:hypothetical protein
MHPVCIICAVLLWPLALVGRCVTCDMYGCMIDTACVCACVWQVTCMLGAIVQLVLIICSWPGLMMTNTVTVHKWACPSVWWANWITLLPNRLGVCGCGWGYAGIPPSIRPDYVEV